MNPRFHRRSPETRVRLIQFGLCGCGDPGHDDNQRVPAGTEGTVADIDDTGTLHVIWDNGRQIGLIPGWDQWEALT